MWWGIIRAIYPTILFDFNLNPSKASCVNILYLAGRLENNWSKLFNKVNPSVLLNMWYCSTNNIKRKFLQIFSSTIFILCVFRNLLFSYSAHQDKKSHIATNLSCWLHVWLCSPVIYFCKTLIQGVPENRKPANFCM